MFRELRLSSIAVDLVTLTTVIDCCCRLSRLDYGFSLLGGISKCGFVPTVTYTTLLKWLLSQEKSLEAERLFEKLLIYEEIQLDAFIFTTIIDGLCKTGHTSVAFMLYAGQ
ncbi:hypothetical protein AgCh_031705 [Apium graveolens]